MMHLSFTITGKPVGKQRAADNSRAPTKRSTPEKTRVYEDKVAKLALAARQEAGIYSPTDKPVCVRLEITPTGIWVEIHELLDSFSKKKPDIDNIEKVIFDGMKGIIYNDDCQVAMVVAKKVR